MEAWVSTVGLLALKMGGGTGNAGSLGKEVHVNEVLLTP
jgi:hypothetical protein